jgi:hypothetical protein
MAPKQLLDRITFRRKATIPASHLSVLDLPLHEYDKATQLPFSIQVGGRSVRPFVGVQEGEQRRNVTGAAGSQQ